MSDQTQRLLRVVASGLPAATSFRDSAEKARAAEQPEVSEALDGVADAMEALVSAAERLNLAVGSEGGQGT